VSDAGAILLATGASVALMAGLWVVGLAIRNWSVVDPGWALCLVLCASIFAATTDGPFRGPRLLSTVCAAVWGLRHAYLLLVHRVIGRPEEGRYVELRTTWGRGAFFAFFQAQAVLAVLLSSPFFLSTRTASTALPLAALAVFVVGLVGEAIADAQLAAWKKDPANRGRTCRGGLWAWSRHPNYFFEFVIWISFALMALGHPLGWLAFTAPATILLLLLFVTGIPPAEKQAIRSRGEDYLAYRRTTSAFVPLPPRKARA